MNSQETQDLQPQETAPAGAHIVRFRVQTPRGLWSMTEPKDATKRPEYPVSTKIEQVILDVRSVFKFVEQDSKYTLLRGDEILEPQRTLASYKIEDHTLLVLSVQGGNA
jgi:hypothetical protein